jgi:hypothetical protein
MRHTSTNLPAKESGSDDSSCPPIVTDSLIPGSFYLVRSNLPGVCVEIENPDSEFPSVSFDFEEEKEDS